MAALLRKLFAITALVVLAAGPNWCQPCEDPSQLFCARGDTPTPNAVCVPRSAELS